MFRSLTVLLLTLFLSGCGQPKPAATPDLPASDDSPVLSEAETYGKLLGQWLHQSTTTHTDWMFSPEKDGRRVLTQIEYIGDNVYRSTEYGYAIETASDGIFLLKLSRENKDPLVERCNFKASYQTIHTYQKFGQLDIHSDYKRVAP